MIDAIKIVHLLALLEELASQDIRVSLSATPAGLLVIGRLMRGGRAAESRRVCAWSSLRISTTANAVIEDNIRRVVTELAAAENADAD